MTGDPKEMSVVEAIQVARSHRDQLVAGSRLLRRSPPDLTDENYTKFISRYCRGRKIATGPVFLEGHTAIILGT